MLALFKNRIGLCIFVFVVAVASVTYAATSSPRVSFLSPTNGATVSGAVKVVVAFSSVDEQSVIKLELYVDRQLVEETPLNPPLLSGEQSYFINTINLANGPHSLLARAYSGPGEIGEASITVYVNNGLYDVTPPLVEILYPKDQQKVSGRVEVKINAQDDREVKYVMLFINNKFKFLKNYPPFSDIWDTTRYPNGLHILQAFAYDAAENKGESKPIKVIVDNPTGQTTLEEKKATTETTEAITPPSLIILPPTGKTEQGRGVTVEAKGKSEPLEVVKEGKTEVTLPTVKEATTPPASKGQAVASSGAEPKEAEGEKGKITLKLSLPKKETVLPPASKGQAVTATGVVPKEAVKVKEEGAKKGESSGVPVLPPVVGPAQAKGAVALPLLGEKAKELPSSGGRTAISSPSVSNPPLAKGLSTSEGEYSSAKQLGKQKPLLIVSKPEENLSFVSQGAFTLGNNYKVHTVQKGEYLIRIAKAYGVPVETLVSVNNLRNPDLIVEGEKLLIPNVTVVYNNSEVMFPDAHPFVENNLPLLPFRAVFEKAGGTVIWHANSREVEAHKGDKNIWLKIGSRKAQVNEQTILMEVAAFIKFNRTYVPATLFHYALDAEIQWDPQTGHLYISAP